MAKVMLQVQQNLKTAMQGEMPHAEAVLTAILGKLSQVLVLGTPGDDESDSESEERGLTAADKGGSKFKTSRNKKSK